MTAIQLTLMLEDEARACVEQIKAKLDDIRALLLNLYEREGWRSLGYESWRACVIAELDQSQSRVYQLLNAAKVDRVLSTVVEKPLPEAQTRELAPLIGQPEALREVYAEVREVTGDRPTAPAIREAVERRLAKAPAAEGVSFPDTQRIRDAHLVSEFSHARRYATQMAAYGPERIAAVLAVSDADATERTLRRLAEWHERFTAARAEPALRVVGGEA